MDYYVVYDLNDNVIAYLETKVELSNFCGIRVKDINYRFKNKKFIPVYINSRIFKIYRFC